MDMETLNLARKYADKLIRGEGAIQGKDGRDGTNGKSAYEGAVEAGYEGTEAEFNEALVQAASGSVVVPSTNIDFTDPAMWT